MNVLLWILLAILALIVLLLILPLHAEITYCADGFSAVVRILFLRIRFPREKQKIKKEPAANTSQKQGGDLKRLFSLLRMGIRAAGKLLPNIRIRNLCVDATVASEDPFQTAMMFGGSAAGVGVLLPLIEKHFNLKNRTVNVNADFESKESKIVLFADCSVLIVNLLAIALCFVYNFWKEEKMKTSVKEREVQHGRTKSE